MGGTDDKFKFGLLFDDVIESPRDLIKDQKSDITIALNIQRTSEWEIVLAWWIAKVVGAAILGGAAKKLGERFAEWAIGVAERMGGNKSPELRAEGLATVSVDKN